MKTFQIGDIVKRVDGGRICNGLYGEVVSAGTMPLMVQDNEGALECDVSDEFEIVGSKETHGHLLDEFVESCAGCAGCQCGLPVVPRL